MMYNIKRIWFDLLCLALLFIIFWFAPATIFTFQDKIGLFSLIVSKLVSVSCGIIHAHITRKVVFTTIDFSNESDPYKKIMVIALYVIIIYSWAKGG